VRDGEEAFISSLFRDLGKLMARFHFFDKTEQVNTLMAQELLDESTASRQVLGVDYDELGLAIAKHWHFPPNLLHAMAPLDAAPLKKPGANDSDRLRIVANMARDLHRSFAGKSAKEQEQSIENLFQRYHDAAQITRESLFETAHKAAHTVKSETAILNVDISKSALMKQLLEGPADKEDEEADSAAMADALAADAENDPTNVLALGMQDMTQMMLGDYHLADIFKLVAELFYRTELFDHVVICVLDRASQSLIGRVGLGQNAAQMRSAFRIPLSFSPDVFHAAIANGQDIMISDASADNIRNRIPEWHHRTLHAHSFLLLPIMVKDKPLGLIYADRGMQPLQISTQLLGLLKTTRNQGALALKLKL
jgi:GAF domain-containing protein